MSPLTITFVEVLTSVTELDKMAANAIGINNFEALIFARLLSPRMTGKKKAAAAVLLMKALMAATAIMVAGNKLPGFLLVKSNKVRPTSSTTPVRIKAAVITSNPKSNMTVSLPNPANAWSRGTNPRMIRVIRTPRAVTSGDTHSKENNSKAITNMISKRMIDIVILIFSLHVLYKEIQVSKLRKKIMTFNKLSCVSHETTHRVLERNWAAF
jgi:hypothetical protein